VATVGIDEVIETQNGIAKIYPYKQKEALKWLLK